MLLEYALIYEAELLADGRDVHLVANLIAGYRGAYSMLIDYPSEESKALFLEAEKNLRKFVVRKRSKRGAKRNNKTISRSN